MKINGHILKPIINMGGPVALFVGLLGVGIILPDLRFQMLRNGGYFFLVGLFVVWLTQVLAYLGHIRCSLRGMLQRYGKGVIAALLLTGVIASSVAPHFRVLDDETNLISVSNTMTRDRKIYGVTQGKHQLGTYYTPLDQYIPKRPLVFPFLVHGLHTITGQRWQNGFLLNLLVLFCFLLMIYTVSLRFTDHWGGLAAMFFFLSNPIAILCARSSGFDLLSAFWLFLVLVNLYGFLKESSIQMFALLWINLILFANIRYENMAFFIIIQTGLLGFKYSKSEYFRAKGALVALTPLLMMPLIWQLWLSAGQFSNPDGTSRISLGYLWPNLKIFAHHQLGLHLPFHSTFSDVALPGFIIIAGYLCWRLARQSIDFKSSSERHFAIIAAVCLCAGLAICLSYVLGQITLRYMQRVFLPFFSVFSLSPMLLLWLFKDRIKGRHLLPPAVVLFVVYLPVSMYPQNNGLYYPEVVFTRQFLEKYHPKQIMVVTDYPGRVSAMGYGAVSFTYANQHKLELLEALDDHEYTDVIAFQRIKTGSEGVYTKTRLDPEFNLEPLAAFKTDWQRHLQVSRVRQRSP